MNNAPTSDFCSTVFFIFLHAPNYVAIVCWVGTEPQGAVTVVDSLNRELAIITERVRPCLVFKKCVVGDLDSVGILHSPLDVSLCPQAVEPKVIFGACHSRTDNLMVSWKERNIWIMEQVVYFRYGCDRSTAWNSRRKQASKQGADCV